MTKPTCISASHASTRSIESTSPTFWAHENLACAESSGPRPRFLRLQLDPCIHLSVRTSRQAASQQRRVEKGTRHQWLRRRRGGWCRCWPWRRRWRPCSSTARPSPRSPDTVVFFVSLSPSLPCIQSNLFVSSEFGRRRMQPPPPRPLLDRQRPRRHSRPRWSRSRCSFIPSRA